MKTNKYGSNAAKLRKNRGYSQEDLGKQVGATKQSISMYERGERAMTPDFIERLADFYNVDINAIYGRATSPVKIPVYGYVAAGIPIETISDILDYEEIDADMLRGGAEYFALKIKGDSMEPKISDGDVVIVRKQPDCDSGQIAIVCVNGDTATCKKVIKHETGISLVPLNQAHEVKFYSSIEVENMPITILGRVVELRAKF